MLIILLTPQPRRNDLAGAHTREFGLSSKDTEFGTAMERLFSFTPSSELLIGGTVSGMYPAAGLTPPPSVVVIIILCITFCSAAKPWIVRSAGVRRSL